MLHHIVTHAGHLVTKDALLEAVWPDTAVSDAILKVSIREIRKVLGDSARAPRFIETVHRRGYRFIAAVTSSHDLASHPLTPPNTFQDTAVQASLMRQRHPSALIEREEGLDLLHQRFNLARQGTRQLVFVSGEAGIGKTALVDAFIHQLSSATAASTWISYGQCIEQYGEGEAYLPLLEVLGQLGHSAAGHRLIDVLYQCAPTWLRQLPGLLSTQDYEGLQQRTGETTPARMLREMAEAIETLTAEHPLVIVLEDLHWSDVSTLDWLAYIARRRPAARLFVIGTYRPLEATVHNHPVHRLAQELILHHLSTELALNYLSVSGIQIYLCQRLDVHSCPEHIAAILHQRTNGNPLFLVVIVDTLMHQSLLRNHEGHLYLSQGLDAFKSSVPEGLRQLIEQQIKRLAPPVQPYLEAASVAGRTFSTAVVAICVGSPPEDVELALATLDSQGQFVRAHDADIWPDGTVSTRYGFTHDLYRETIYKRIPAGQRVRWHHQIGSQLESAYGARAPEIAVELASHFLHGHTADKAIQYSQYAGQQAIARSAFREAVHHFEQAITLLPTNPETQDALELALTLRLALRRALHPLGEFERTLSVLREATPLAERLEDWQRLGQLHCFMSMYCSWTGNYPQAVKSGEQALAIHHKYPDTADLDLLAHIYLGTALHSLGVYDQAMSHLRQPIAALQHDRLYAQCGAPYFPAIFARAWLMYCLAEVGEFTAGHAIGEETLQLAATIEEPLSQVVAPYAAGFLHLRQGAAAQAAAHLEQSLSLCREWDVQLLLPWVLSALGTAYVHLHRLDEAFPLLEEALAHSQSMHLKLWQPVWLLGLSEAHLHAGAPETALTFAQQALEHARTHHERGHEAWALFALGQAYTQAHSRRHQTTIDAYRQALNLAESLGLRPLQAHCYHQLSTQSDPKAAQLLRARRTSNSRT